MFESDIILSMPPKKKRKIKLKIKSYKKNKSAIHQFRDEVVNKLENNIKFW